MTTFRQPIACNFLNAASSGEIGCMPAASASSNQSTSPSSKIASMVPARKAFSRLLSPGPPLSCRLPPHDSIFDEGLETVDGECLVQQHSRRMSRVLADRESERIALLFDLSQR